MGYKEQLLILLKQYTQAELADLLNVTQRSIGNYISEENSTKPYPKTQRKLNEVFSAIIVEGKTIEEYQGIESPEREVATLSNRLKKKNSTQPYLVPFFPVKAQAGYVKAYDQEVYMDTLEKYALPPGVNPHGAVWRYWEVEGDSMEPAFKSGDVILTSQVPQMDWENLRNYYLYVIVTAERVLLKRIYCKNLLEWVLISDNEENYPQQLLPSESVKEVWVFRRSIRADAKPPKVFEIKI
jgi:phage repressor protein C with HTH and peptisase S24 domain